MILNEDRMKTKERIDKLRNKFEEITNILPPVYMYPYAVDIIALDEKLKVPDGISTRNYIKQKYGLKAARIAEELCNLMVF